MIQRFLEFLSNLGSAKSKPRRRRRSRGPRPGYVKCKNCGVQIKVGAPRCLQCGARVVDRTPSMPNPQSVDGRTPDGGPLDESQKKLLVATQASRESTITVLAGAGTTDGEVKAGEMRIFGNDAVDAVARLCASGFLDKTDDVTFTLTEEGRLAAILIKTRELGE